MGRAAVPPVPARARRSPGSRAGVFRLQQGRRLPLGELGAVRRRARRRGGVRRPRHQPALLPRPRRGRRPGRRADLRRDPGPAQRRGAGLHPHHRAGRGHLRALRAKLHGAQAPGGLRRGHAGSVAPGHRVAAGIGARLRDHARDRRAGRGKVRRPDPPGPGLHRLLHPVDPAARDRGPEHGLAPDRSQADFLGRRSTRDPVGAVLVAVAGEPAGLVRRRHRRDPLGRRRRGPLAGPADPLPGVAVFPFGAGQHGPGHGQSVDGPGADVLAPGR